MSLTSTSLLILSGCAQMRPASHAWDEPAPRPAQMASKQWGGGSPESWPSPAAKPTAKPTAAPVKPGLRPVSPSSSPTSQDPRWKVTPPGLEAPLTPTQASGPVVEVARNYLGVPYLFGGDSPEKGFDCSGLVHYVFRQRGQQISRLANEQFREGRAVDRKALQPGDLVFFSVSGSGVDHVGIYAGDELFIHAPRTGRTVSYDSLKSAYFAQRYQGARRLD